MPSPSKFADESPRNPSFFLLPQPDTSVRAGHVRTAATANRLPPRHPLSLPRRRGPRSPSGARAGPVSPPPHGSARPRPAPLRLAGASSAASLTTLAGEPPGRRLAPLSICIPVCASHLMSTCLTYVCTQILLLPLTHL